MEVHLASEERQQSHPSLGTFSSCKLRPGGELFFPLSIHQGTFIWVCPPWPCTILHLITVTLTLMHDFVQWNIATHVLGFIFFRGAGGLSKGGSLQTRSNASEQKVSKVKHYFGWFWALKHHEFFKKWQITLRHFIPKLIGTLPLDKIFVLGTHLVIVSQPHAESLHEE